MTKYTIFALLGLALAVQGTREYLNSDNQLPAAGEPKVQMNPHAVAQPSGVKPLTESLLLRPATSEQPDAVAAQPPALPAAADAAQLPSVAVSPSSAETAKATDQALSATDPRTPISDPQTALKADPLKIAPHPPAKADSGKQVDPAVTPAVAQESNAKQSSPTGTIPLGPVDPALPSVAKAATNDALKSAVDWETLRPADARSQAAWEEYERLKKAAAAREYSSLRPLITMNDAAVKKPAISETAQEVTVKRQQPYIIPDGSGQPGNPTIPLGQQNGLQTYSSLNEMRNPEQVKRDSKLSHETLRGAIYLSQQEKFPAVHRLSGRELALQDVFYQAGSREQRFELIKAYWRTALAVAEYHWALEEYFQIQPLDGVAARNRVPSNTPSHQYIEAAIYSSTARFSELKSTAITAQYDLMARMGASRTLPIPVDLPMVGTYNTNFEATFPDGRGATQRLRSINSTIDLRRDTINTRAIACYKTNSAWEMAQAMFNQSPTDQNSQIVALAYEQLTRHRKSFLAAVRDYNTDIAEYVLLTASSNIRPESLAGQLVRNPSRPLWNTQAGVGVIDGFVARQTLVDDQVRPATFSGENAGEAFSRAQEIPSVMVRPSKEPTE